MKKPLLFIFICQTAIAQSTNSDTLNQMDPATGLKQGYWIVLNSVKKLPNYSMEAKVEEGTFVDSKKMGIWKMFFPNGNIKSEITFTNNKPSGYAKMYYENGKVQEEGNWENNRWVGDYKQYYENGQAIYDFKYTASGKRDGEQTYFHENGQVMMKGVMKDGKESGVWEGYYENGDLREKKSFNDGALDPDNTEIYAPKKPLPPKKEVESKEPPKIADASKEKANAAYKPFDGNGYAKLFFAGARLSKDGEFKNFRLMDGKDYIYNSDGILDRIAVYKAGKYVGDAPIEEKDK
ncbi:MAG: toxin-antitoxin system YwqK family antitoxin [Bacteroidetes bacterium]|nr:MAG: toxin-antitoxin system YwqK family antitoxin [Bacteroidota bacterium]